jgi:hypothetical protein
MPPHILAVFNQLYEELKAMKQQQWTITNYGALRDLCSEAAISRCWPCSIEIESLSVRDRNCRVGPLTTGPIQYGWNTLSPG